MMGCIDTMISCFSYLTIYLTRCGNLDRGVITDTAFPLVADHAHVSLFTPPRPPRIPDDPVRYPVTCRVVAHDDDRMIGQTDTRAVEHSVRVHIEKCVHVHHGKDRTPRERQLQLLFSKDILGLKNHWGSALQPGAVSEGKRTGDVRVNRFAAHPRTSEIRKRTPRGSAAAPEIAKRSRTIHQLLLGEVPSLSRIAIQCTFEKTDASKGPTASALALIANRSEGIRPVDRPGKRTQGFRRNRHWSLGIDGLFPHRSKLEKFVPPRLVHRFARHPRRGSVYE